MKAKFLRKDVSVKRDFKADEISGNKSELLTVTIDFVSYGNTSTISYQEIIDKVIKKITDEL
jgi:hypothetical protein